MRSPTSQHKIAWLNFVQNDRAIRSLYSVLFWSHSNAVYSNKIISLSLSFIVIVIFTVISARRGGGARLDCRPLHGESKIKLFSIWGAFLLHFSPHEGIFHQCAGLFAIFSPCGRPFLSFWGAFLGYAPPTKNFCGRPCQ